jgi:hypothetical protein
MNISDKTNKLPCDELPFGDLTCDDLPFDDLLCGELLRD